MPKLSDLDQRGKTHINAPVSPSSPLNPGISIDEIKARIRIPHRSPIIGRGKASSRYLAPPRWIDLVNGKVAVRSLGFNSILMRFNPSQLEYGNNLWKFSDELSQSIHAVFRKILPRLPELRAGLGRREAIRLHTGRIDLSELHLAADFIFPKYTGRPSFFRTIHRGWTWARGKVINQYDSGLYFRQRGWTLVAYDKGEQVDKSNPGMPDWQRWQSANRLRLELRLHRRDLRSLGARLHRAHPDRPLIDLSMAADWSPSLYGSVFDLYAARIRPRSGPYTNEAIPLYGLLTHLGAKSVWKRETEGEYHSDPEFL